MTRWWRLCGGQGRVGAWVGRDGWVGWGGVGCVGGWRARVARQRVRARVRGILLWRGV